jgi:CheY-like chemotaxis protein
MIPKAPRSAATAVFPLWASPPSAADEGRRILVVDDNLDSAETSAMLLRAANHDVMVAHDGPSGLRAAADFRPELVLLDIGLPGMNGYDVARELRRLPGLARTVIVAVTGYGEEESRRQAREASMDHFVTKPMDVDRIYEIIAGLPDREE